MSDTISSRAALQHSHSFLGAGHKRSERKAWAVIWLCGAMMIAEVIGGMLFGSIALVADGMHMSTHAGALLLAALAYTSARKYADDPRFTFGTGKFGDLAGFTSAIILAMIALLIGCATRSNTLEVQHYVETPRCRKSPRICGTRRRPTQKRSELSLELIRARQRLVLKQMQEKALDQIPCLFRSSTPAAGHMRTRDTSRFCRIH
jgi:hypothetical protein